MRDKLNNSPAAQIGVVVVLLLAAAYLLLGGMGGGEESEEAASTEATVTVAGTGASGSATGATPGEAVEAAAEGALEAAGAEATAASVTAEVPAPPLPHPVRAAYAANKTVVLLVVHDGGIDDKLVADSVSLIRALPDVAVFVVPAKQIYRYAAITLGVEVNRVPALVVMRPRKLSEGTPQASVDYGFQSAQSIVQAVKDASYDGPTVSYHPE